MSRLTNDNYEDDTLHLKNHKTQWEYNNELWQYAKEREDIEEELGIDLITLFKALNTPIYIKTNYDDTLVNKTLWCSNSLIWGIGEPIIKVGDYAVYTKEYGKTWALTKEDLL